MIDQKVNHSAPLRSRMIHNILLEIPGFAIAEQGRSVFQSSPSSRTSAEWYSRVRRDLLDRLGRQYFPVFRFSDGECYFCLGYRIPPAQRGQIAVIHYARTAVSAYVKYRCHTAFWSGHPGYGHEVYRGRRWRELRSEFSDLLREIAQDGLIAGCFCRHHVPAMMDRYIPDIYDWFDKEGIRLDEDNYIPFYFVYALLLGPDRHLFLRNRKILVITNLSGEKEQRLRTYLEGEGCRSVNFLGISRSSSMTDRIKLLPEHSGTDLVLIGAGVGAANILCQVTSLGALSIDAGYVLECYQNPDYKGTRVFTLPDEEFEECNQPMSITTCATK